MSWRITREVDAKLYCKLDSRGNAAGQFQGRKVDCSQ